MRNLLSGDVRRSGNKLRIDMELDDTVTGGKCVDRYTRQEAKPSSSSPQLAVCRTHAGETASARAASQNLPADGRHRYVDRTHPAAIHAALGDGAGAMAQLEEAYRDRSAHMDGVWMDPWSSRLHGDARFEASPG